MRSCTARLRVAAGAAVLLALTGGCSSRYEKLTEGTVPHFCYSTLADADCYAQPLPAHEDLRFLGIYLYPESIGPTNQQWLDLARDHFDLDE